MVLQSECKPSAYVSWVKRRIEEGHFEVDITDPKVLA